MFENKDKLQFLLHGGYFFKKEAEEYVIAIKLDDKSKMILC